MTESDYALGPILNLDIISSDITQSFYQDVVSHEQNGISSIELREAMELYISKNQRIFQRFKDVQDKFNEMQAKIVTLESSNKRNSLSNIREEKAPQSSPGIKSKELDKLNGELVHLKEEIDRLDEARIKLEKDCEGLKTKNAKLNKENEAIAKKIDVQSEKSYVIKLMIDEYYNELEKNLLKIGGLTHV